MFIEKWEFTTKQKQDISIYPDGCRDIIFTFPKYSSPNFHFYQLSDRTETKSIDSDLDIVGFRFGPDASIETKGILRLVESAQYDLSIIESEINNHIFKDRCLGEIMDTIANSDTCRLNSIKSLGISERTLQRILKEKSGQSPKFWLQLARARKAAKHLCRFKNIKETSYTFEYADQAHFTRDMRKWFAKSPREIMHDEAFYKVLCAVAFC